MKAEKKILLIEGEIINSDLLKQYLESNFKLIYAKDSHDVLTMMNEQYVDMILLNTDYESFGLSASDIIKYIQHRLVDQKTKIVLFSNEKNANEEGRKDLSDKIFSATNDDETIEGIAKILNIAD